MKKLFLALMIAFASINATAHVNAAEATQTIDVSNMPEDKLKQVQEIVNSAKETTDIVTTIASPDILKQYADVGKGVAVGIAEAAKTLGIVVTDFVKSDVGWWVMVIIMYKVVGAGIIASIFWIIFAIVWGITFNRMWIKYFDRLCINSKVVETIAPDGTKTIAKVGLEPYDEYTIGYRVGMFIILVLINMPVIIAVANALT
jgi:hypothetical protein